MYPNFTLFCIPEGTTQVRQKLSPSPPLFIHRFSTSYPQVIHRLPMLAWVLHKIPQGEVCVCMWIPMYPITTVCIHRLTQVLYCGIHTRTHSIEGRLICLRHGYLFATQGKLVVDRVAQVDTMAPIKTTNTQRQYRWTI